MSTDVAFCFWRVVSGSAVELALTRLMRLFEIGGATTDSILQNSLLSAAKLQSDWVKVRARRTIVCANIWQLLLLKPLLVGSGSTFVFWVQGLVAEESYLKRGSRLRYITLRLLEAISFLVADAYVFVSCGMRDFYYERYNYISNRPFLVTPCTSDLSISSGTDRRKGSFCYLGGMAKWQKFDAVVRVMNKIVACNNGVTFNIATRERKICEESLAAVASPELLRVTSVCSLSSKHEVEEFLSSNEFGFLLRDHHSINTVASPIKLAEYLSCGVTVITTDAISSYSSLLGDAGYVLDISEFLSSPRHPSFVYRGPRAALQVHKNYFSPESSSADVTGFLIRLGALV